MRTCRPNRGPLTNYVACLTIACLASSCAKLDLKEAAMSAQPLNCPVVEDEPADLDSEAPAKYAALSEITQSLARPSRAMIRYVPSSSVT